MHFSLTAWAACAPGLHQHEDWLAWASQPHAPRRLGRDGDVPAVPEMPAMTRRRLSPLGRTAVQAAWWCQDAVDTTGDAPGGTGCPVIFASRYGDVQRTLQLQDELASGQALSPTAFGLSVHNAISAQYSIARGDRGNYIAIAAGAASAAAGLLEAGSLLADGAREVLLVCHEEGVPAPYDRYVDPAESTDPSMAWAWAWRIAATDASDAQFTLTLGDADAGTATSAAPTAAPALPFGLDLLRFVLSGEPHWSRDIDGQSWTLQRQSGQSAQQVVQARQATLEGAGV